MWEWLLSPIDPSRAHEVGTAISWHARSMVLAWGVLAPLAVLIARFFKVLPGQDWPRQLDNPLWWRSHWMGQSLVALLTIVGLALVWDGFGADWHGWIGYAVIGLLCCQVLLGLFRGSKGGPTAPAADGSWRGDHYDMTPWRLAFEHVHKSAGYLTLFLAAVAIVLGLWQANGPRWMWLTLTFWWIGLISAGWYLQNQGRAMDTYQAIWGPSPEHPGNRRKPPLWGMRRMDEEGAKRDQASQMKRLSI